MESLADMVQKMAARDDSGLLNTLIALNVTSFLLVLGFFCVLSRQRDVITDSAMKSTILHQTFKRFGISIYDEMSSESDSEDSDESSESDAEDDQPEVQTSDFITAQTSNDNIAVTAADDLTDEETFV